MLSTEEMEKILLEEVNGKPPTIEGPEAVIFREKMKNAITKIEAAGQVVDIPAEWPDAARS